MREQQGSGDVAGRRGGVIRSLLGVERRLAEGDAEGAVGVSSGKQPATEGGGGGDDCVDGDGGGGDEQGDRQRRALVAWSHRNRSIDDACGGSEDYM